MLYGVDISNYQSDLNPAAIPCDFVIVKATGGPGPRYVNPHWVTQINAARAAGKLTGLYHFSGDGWMHTSPEQEADHFINTIRPHQAGAALVLDFEVSDRNQHPSWPVNDPGWALAFLRRVTNAFGRKPWVYANGQALGFNMSAIAAEGYPLWHAYYSDRPVYGYTPDMGRPAAPHFGPAPMWQFTQFGNLPGYGSALDLNAFYGSVDDWNRLAGLAGELLIPDLPGIPKT